ncbi:putative copper resistance D transmembrane protein (Copper resistance D) (CopD-like) [Herminiimonas arsenicoxydans]|uniref:Copper resistance D transmembrane protein (Copper resistance D) (CopD-like) n=1 Tax=Herminiimonas arsenicoxydans TaxID=204773 RepID=A4G2L5_HERAR|nr:putative copper resistance D transmembrane protein (Copper resistance D) (CopD-like) [Herminiimonas arsenicoxydans]
MADDWLNIALRFGLYIGTATLFGVAVFGIFAHSLTAQFAALGTRFKTGLLMAVGLNIVLSLMSMLVSAKAMSGSESYDELTAHIIGMVITGTDMGIAWLVRMAGLLICALIILVGKWQNKRFVPLAIISAVSFATFAWSGHAAMHEGIVKAGHLMSDITHLLAAGAWVGALFSLVTLATFNPHSTPNALEVLSKTSSGFAKLGTVIVGALVVTGLANYLLIAGPSLNVLTSTQYGLLLVIKLGLFMGMLAIAAANRYLLSPKVEIAIRLDNGVEACRLLRVSLITETSLALLVVACVAWLGVLSPVAHRAS